jgi:hypothetical protein
MAMVVCLILPTFENCFFFFFFFYFFLKINKCVFDLVTKQGLVIIYIY